ncbi:OLC1v1006242C1 [Oldenlandia corymbosa var. corymbosa]|uniref:OLC1v1006242C1 n=1 Tax=Oldenlandia corymbosa var. corymbosa TaxID=529605 RepID=A0AAV1DGV6_OLDCO|nr:OLC1v1006242C1 [Oldenlandia corymbosa var. corymbosa]
MKFLTSSSSSASSTITTTTTSTSFDAGCVRDSRSSPASCIAGVFRRLLCLNDPPTHHPSHHFKYTENHDSVSLELDRFQCSKAEESSASGSTPNLVARLMGLESFPQIDFPVTERSPNSISRSRSMNSVDLMKELASMQGRHRRAKSFRETRSKFVELQDEDFYILSFEDEDEFGKLGARSRKSEMGSGQKQTKQGIKGENSNSKAKSNKKRESVYEKNKENLLDTRTIFIENPEAINSKQVSKRVVFRGGDNSKLKDSINILRPTNSSCRNSAAADKEVEKLAKPIIQKSENDLQLGRRRMKKRKDDCLLVKRIETEPDSENSSPSSVLDVTKFPGDPEVTSCPGEPSRLTNSRSRRTLAEDLENYRKLNYQSNSTSFRSNNNSSSCERKRIDQLRKDGHGSSSRFMQMWGEIYNVAGRNTVQADWLLNNRREMHKFEEYKEIGGEIQMQILDELIGEMVDQLVNLC